METFDLYGYQRVTTPPVEYADVIERGLGTVDRRDLVRFVEPDSGEVALLRPDITPADRPHHRDPPAGPACARGGSRTKVPSSVVAAAARASSIKCFSAGSSVWGSRAQRPTPR